MTDKIKEAAEKYAFRVPYDGSNNFYNEDRYKGFVDGATSEAAREYWDAAREDEAGELFTEDEVCMIYDLFIIEKRQSFRSALQEYKNNNQ